jgi:hypothetical protein
MNMIPVRQVLGNVGFVLQFKREHQEGLVTYSETLTWREVRLDRLDISETPKVHRISKV